MIRKIITIDEDKCNGCGLCASACHEGALRIIDGKAKLISDSYCDGLGNCLPECPTNAIRIVEREAAAFDEEAVAKHVAAGSSPAGAHAPVSQLGQWPCQIKLVPANAPYFDNANLLIAADCTAYAYANIHQDFMRNKITLIGCPKLDEGDYSQKLAQIFANNDLKSITVLRMEVPCCGGLVHAVKNAMLASGTMVPWKVVTISTDGNIIED